MPSSRLASGLLQVLALSSVSILAADYYWNPSTSIGNWMSSNWNASALGPTYAQAWADSNTANFSGANQTITVNSFITPAGINFTADGIRIVSGSGGTNDLRLSGSVPVSVSGANTATIAEDVNSIGAGSALVKQGTGTLILSGSNSITSVNISAGTLQLGSNSAFGSASSNPALIINGTLDLAGFSAARGSLSGSGTVTNSVPSTTSTLTIGSSSGASSTFGGNIVDGAGTVALSKTGTSTQILTGANTYTGTTSILGGTLQIGNGGTSGTLPAGPVNVASGATFRINKSSSETFSGVLSGSGTLAVTGGGNLSVGSSASGFTGLTAVSGGSGLFIGASHAADVSVTGAGSRLGGDGGAFTGAVSLAAQALLMPGSASAGSTGSLTFADGFTLAGDSANPANRATFAVDVAGPLQGVSTSGYDTLFVTGGMAIIDGAILDFGAFTGTYAFGDRITLIDGSGSANVVGTFFAPSGDSLTNGSIVAELSGLGGQLDWMIFYTGQDVYITAIPEPSSALCLAAGSLGLALSMRRRARSPSPLAPDRC